MTKNGRRALFLLVATVLNMLLTIVIMVAVYIALSAIFGLLKVEAGFVGVLIIGITFLSGIVLSGLVYSRALKAIRKRPELEERFGLLK